jgi:hypothetical protein
MKLVFHENHYYFSFLKEYVTENAFLRYYFEFNFFQGLWSPLH